MTKGKYKNVKTTRIYLFLLPPLPSHAIVCHCTLYLELATLSSPQIICGDLNIIAVFSACRDCVATLKVERKGGGTGLS